MLTGLMLVLAALGQEAAAEKTATDPPNDPAAKKPADPAGDAAARKLADTVRAELNQGADKIVEASRKLGRQVVADLTYQSEIARLGVWILEFERARADLLDEAHTCEEERKSSKAKLEADLRALRETSGDDPKHLDEEIVQLIEREKPYLVELKAEQEAYLREAAQLADQLVDLRRERQRLDRLHKWHSQNARSGLGRDWKRPPLPDLKSVTERLAPAPKPGGKLPSVQEALNSLKDL
jgi:hypothetical protein